MTIEQIVHGEISKSCVYAAYVPEIDTWLELGYNEGVLLTSTGDYYCGTVSHLNPLVYVPKDKPYTIGKILKQRDRVYVNVYHYIIYIDQIDTWLSIEETEFQMLIDSNNYYVSIDNINNIETYHLKEENGSITRNSYLKIKHAL